jgi:short-subunit dehydrogenase
LTGRDESRLNEVAQRCRGAGAVAESLILELGFPGAIETLVAALGPRSLAVLVNNAGFGVSGALAEADAAGLTSMIRLNVETLTLMTRALVPSMLERGSGRILNVASTASFQPVPFMAAYAATKAYVLSFSEALAEELAGTGVTVTALCPGPTKSRFAYRASMGTSALFRSAMTPEAVARIGVRALLKGQRSRVAGVGNALMAFGVRFSPRSLNAKLAKFLMRKD